MARPVIVWALTVSVRGRRHNNWAVVLITLQDCCRAVIVAYHRAMTVTADCRSFVKVMDDLFTAFQR